MHLLQGPAPHGVLSALGRQGSCHRRICSPEPPHAKGDRLELQLPSQDLTTGGLAGGVLGLRCTLDPTLL